MGVISPTHVLLVLSSMYLLIVSCGSFTLGRLFDFIFAHLWLIRALYFSLKIFFSGIFFFKLIILNVQGRVYQYFLEVFGLSKQTFWLIQFQIGIDGDFQEELRNNASI